MLVTEYFGNILIAGKQNHFVDSLT